MSDFLSLYAESAYTSLGLFWMAFWAFGLGYLVSSIIQEVITHDQMQSHMGDATIKSISTGTFFGFISSSCSFAALSTTRALFTRGAGLTPAISFLLASTNLVIELGLVIAMFLSWHFVVAEYVGGLLLIIISALIMKFTLSESMEENAREHAQDIESQHHHHDSSDNDSDSMSLAQKMGSVHFWKSLSNAYLMEWKMVWQEVTVGFTVAGVISTMVPKSFFKSLFIGSGQADAGFFDVLIQAIIGPVAAFFTFIGSMGNIPLAAVLASNGVSFAGVIAFIFSDLVVFPVLKIQAKYYGWKMALYIAGVMFAALVSASIILHYGFDIIGLLPEPSTFSSITERNFFKMDYSFWLNILFIVLTGGSLALKHWGSSSEEHGHHHDHGSDESLIDKAVKWAAYLSFVWLGLGLILHFIHA